MNFGYTEHGHRHISIVSKRAGEILQKLGYPERTVELAQIAGYLYSGLVLGIGIPKLNIYMTNKSEARRKAKLAEKKAMEAELSSQNNLINKESDKINLKNNLSMQAFLRR